MGGAIGGALPLAIGVALSPIPIIAVVLMLTTPSARVNGPAFVIGWLAGLAVVGAIVLAVSGPAGASSSGGRVENGCAVCPRHAWSFQLSDGCMRDLPGVGIRTYPTRRFARPGQADLIQAELPIY